MTRSNLFSVHFLKEIAFGSDIYYICIHTLKGGGSRSLEFRSRKLDSRSQISILKDPTRGGGESASSPKESMAGLKKPARGVRGSVSSLFDSDFDFYYITITGQESVFPDPQ